MDTVTEDKKGQALAAQRFQMLEDIAKDLSGDVTFPICFDVTLKLRKVLSDPDASIAQISQVVTGDPLVCSRLLSLANSVAYNPLGVEIRDINSVIQRLGINAVRTSALSLAIKQMMLSKGMAEFENLTKSLWDHSILTASAAAVIAERHSRLSRDDAMLAGLVHDIGVFYMLYRATHYEEIRSRPDTMKHLVIQWHESIGESLLNALGVPEKISLAIRDHDQPRPFPPAMATLADIVYAANILAGGFKEWLLKDVDAANSSRDALDQTYLALMPEIQERAQELRAVFN